MYQLHLANKNYSSWSPRPWVLMKTLAMPFAAHLVPFADGAPGVSRGTKRKKKQPAPGWPICGRSGE